MTTSNYFEAGHRIRLPNWIERIEQHFPRFDRNLNTAWKNYDESKGMVAHNAVHHSKAVSIRGQGYGTWPIRVQDHGGEEVVYAAFSTCSAS